MIIFDILIVLVIVILCGRIIFNLILAAGGFIIAGFMAVCAGIMALWVGFLWVCVQLVLFIEFIGRWISKLWRIAIGQEK